MKRGQVTIFIILAILIVGGIIVYFSLRDSSAVGMSEDLEPVYDYYLNCVSDATERGVKIMGSKGGYIEDPSFEAGSIFMPQSSQLDFFGQAVPYWLYVSGNNILREQVPSKSKMGGQLEDFIEREIMKCDFSDFEEMGYSVYFDDADVYVNIEELAIDVKVDQDLFIYKGNSSSKVSSHEVSVSSKFGKFYDMALEVYNFEKSDAFLEEYALDVMRLYAPVDGSEIGCSVKVFDDAEIREDIVNGLVSNVAFLKLNGDYYDLPEGDKGYFVVDELESDERVNFMYLEDWPTRVEIYGDRVIAPVGLQEGLGSLGFCYVPYHLVYDINFPVLIQFFDGEEIFQFPIVVIISKNQARQAMSASGFSSVDSEICTYKNQEVTVNTYDKDLNPVESRIRFKCLDEVCGIGETVSDGEISSMTDYFPQCLNGFILASAEGYADSKYQISTNVENLANVVMRKKYDVDLDFGSGVDSALISFVGSEYSTSVFYPDSSSVELVEDYYNVSVYVYENSSLTLGDIEKTQCVDVASGVGGFFGITSEECFDLTIPGFEISNAVVGGGVARQYILEEELQNAYELNVNVPLFGTPKDIEDLQVNYELAGSEKVYLDFE